jgi:hypothetical protein
MKKSQSIEKFIYKIQVGGSTKKYGKQASLTSKIIPLLELTSDLLSKLMISV